MKLRVAHEERWQVVPGGSHDDSETLDLPRETVGRIRRAEKEWYACLGIIADAWIAERKRKGKDWI